jgi:hypothetical protein
MLLVFHSQIFFFNRCYKCMDVPHNHFFYVFYHKSHKGSKYQDRIILNALKFNFFKSFTYNIDILSIDTDNIINDSHIQKIFFSMVSIRFRHIHIHSQDVNIIFRNFIIFKNIF